MNKIFTLLILVSIQSSLLAQPSQADMDKMKAAIDACATELGLEKPSQGSRPSREDMEKMDSCLASKGFEKPEPPKGKPSFNR